MQKNIAISVIINIFNTIMLVALFMVIGGFASFAFGQASTTSGLLSLGFGVAGVASLFSIVLAIMFTIAEKNKVATA